jgi:hypothetical protein
MDMSTWRKTAALGTALSLLGLAEARAQSVAAAEVPAISIVSPAAGATVALGDDAGKTVVVKIAVTNFTIRPVGQCAGAPNCGHVHLKIDHPSDACNAPNSGGNSTNAAAGGNTIEAHFGFCPTPSGQHVIAVALAKDDHSFVLVDGKPVSAVVAVSAK